MARGPLAQLRYECLHAGLTREATHVALEVISMVPPDDWHDTVLICSSGRDPYCVQTPAYDDLAAWHRWITGMVQAGVYTIVPLSAAFRVSR